MRYALALIVFLFAAPALADDYLSALPDLPLMPGMAEIADETLVFDKPSGRIVESGAVVAAKPDEIREFYAQSLPQLGWRRDASLAYSRDGEKLVITLTPVEGKTHVKFSLAPL